MQPSMQSANLLNAGFGDERHDDLASADVPRRRLGLVKTRFSPDGRLLVSGKLDGTVMLWDVATGHALGPALIGDRAPITSLDFGPDGKTFASIDIFGTVVLWDVATRRPVGSPFTASSVGASRIQFSPDGKALAVIGMDKPSSAWTIRSRCGTWRCAGRWANRSAVKTEWL